MNKKSELLHFYDNYYNLIANLEKEDKFADKFYQAFLAGENEVYQKYIKETKLFDETWIKTVESYVPSINKIVLNPRSTIKVEEEVVAVERAKKITSESVKHLAANTHMIKDIQPDGMVRPKNILTSFTDIDYGTYENRFIMTLIDRLFIFVRSRYDLIKTNIESFEKRRFHLKSNFPLNTSIVDLELNFTLTDEIEDEEIHEFNQNILKRVEYLNKIVTSLRASSFMDLMKDQRKIYPPIMKTNVILKNVDFRNAYMLWLFLDRYNTLAFTTEIEEKNLTFTDKYFSDINRQALTLYSSIIANQEMNKEIYENIQSKKFRKKSIKIKRTHPDDIHLTEEDEMLEDQTLNEYYLAQNKRIFEQSLEYHAETSATYETSVKRALRETLNISNALYQSFFELEENDDVFTRLIREVDVNKELQEARRKVLISKMIREVKEVDFNNALRQEKKFLDEIAKYDTILLKEHKQNLTDEKELIAKTEKLEKDRKQALLEKEILDEQLKENKYLSEQINNYRIEVNKKINDYQKELNKQFKEETRAYQNELRALTRQALKEYKDKHKPQRRVTNERLKVEKDKLDDNYKNKEQQILKTHSKTLKQRKQTLKKQSEEKIKVDKEKYANMLKENQANLTILEKHEQKYLQKINKLITTLDNKQKLEMDLFNQQLKRDEMTKIALHRQKYKITNRVTNYRLKQELKKLEQRLVDKEQRLKQKAKDNLQKDQAKLKTKSTTKVDNLEKKLIARKEQNKRNQQILKEVKKYLNEQMKKIK